MKTIFGGAKLGIGLALIALVAASIGSRTQGWLTTSATTRQASRFADDARFHAAMPLVTTSDRPIPLEQHWSAALAKILASGRITELNALAGRATFSETMLMLQWATHVDDRDIRFEVRRALLARLARLNGAAASEFFETLATFERLPALSATIAAEWAASEPAAAVGWFKRRATNGVDAETATALGGALAGQSLEMIRALAGSIEAGEARYALCDAVVQRWKHERALDAANLAIATVSGEACASLLGAVLPEWARSDLVSAVEWAKQLPDGAHKLTALIHLSYPWVEANVSGVAEFAQALPPGNEQFVAVTVDRWAQSDPRAAADWAVRLPDGPVRDRAIASLTNAWTRRDPLAAADFALGLHTGPGRQEAIVSVVSGWAAHDPRAAGNWVENFPTGETRSYGIGNVADTWMRTDPVAAMAWVQRLPAGSDRDTALHASAGCLLELHPDLAATVAAAISDETLRNAQTERAIAAWMAVDRTAAMTWIADSSLSSALKRQFLTPRS